MLFRSAPPRRSVLPVVAQPELARVVIFPVYVAPADGYGAWMHPRPMAHRTVIVLMYRVVCRCWARSAPVLWRCVVVWGCVRGRRQFTSVSADKCAPCCLFVCLFVSLNALFDARAGARHHLAGVRGRLRHPFWGARRTSARAANLSLTTRAQVDNWLTLADGVLPRTFVWLGVEWFVYMGLFAYLSAVRSARMRSLLYMCVL